MYSDMLGQVVRKLVQLPVDMMGTLFDLLEKLIGSSGQIWFRRLKRFLRGENPFGVPKFFEITTNDRSGQRHIMDLYSQGYHVDGITREVLYSNKFVATNGVTSKLALIMGDEFKDEQRTDENIRAEAAKRGYLDPPVELSPYVREMFSDEDLEQTGLSTLVVMHQPVTSSTGYLILLGLYRLFGGRILLGFAGLPDLSRDTGFLFLVPASN